MPCYDDGADWKTGELPADKLKRLDKITELLCETCRKLEETGELGVLSIESLKWWVNHKQVDAERKRQFPESDSQARRVTR